MRIEDIDTPRVRAGSEQRILEDMAWLGLDWDEGAWHGPASPYHQSERRDLYEAALRLLESKGLTFKCDCSRKEIAHIATAPHPGQEGPIYPGTCRRHAKSVFRRPPATRFAVPYDALTTFHDLVQGSHQSNVAKDTGDFVLQRGDGVFSYQLAACVDDITQGITQVVRGADLLDSTPRQQLLIRALGATPPSYAHAPLILGRDGEKLAKRAQGVPIRDHRKAGLSPERVVSYLARAIGLIGAGQEGLRPIDLVSRFSWDRVRPGPIRLDPIDLYR